MLSATLLGLVGLIVAAGVRSADRDAELRMVRNEAEKLYAAFEKYYWRHREYPRAYTGKGFDLETLDPLASRGYYRGVPQNRLWQGRADAYDSPDDQGQNQEFWLELTLRMDPSIRLLVANSDDSPLGGGRLYQGVFILRSGKLEPI